MLIASFMAFSRFSLLLVTLVIAGCTYPMDYQSQATPTFPAGQSKQKIVVVGVDERGYLKRKEIRPQYVGVFRDLMLAIPYKWVTKSKNPVADDLAINIAKGLSNAGYHAEALANPDIESSTAGIDAAKAAKASRIILVRVKELESDTQWRTEYVYDLNFDLLSGSGKPILSTQVKDTIMMAGSPLPTVTAQIKVPTKAGQITEEGIKPLLEKL